MKRVQPILFLLAALLAAVAWGRSAQPAIAAPVQQGANLLNNPSFERPYANGAANGWGRWHQETGGNTVCEGSWAGQPIWSEETNPDLVRDGSISQHVGNEFNKWHAGVMQDVTVTPGTRYRFSFWARGRASNDQYPAPSLGFINLNVQARIDPQGRGQWNAADLVYGAVGNPHDAWQQFSVEATAVGNKITVFVSANLRDSQCARHMDVWFDQAQLVEVGPPPTATSPPRPTSPPPPPRTNTPIPPTDTPTPEVTPTNTPVPTDTPTPTPEPPKGGTICINAFADDNKNGVRDDNEGYMAGVTFTIVQDGQLITQGVSPGIPNPLCFEGLEPGAYQIAQQAPETLELTTAANTLVSVTEGETIGVEFGSRFRPPEEPTPESVSVLPTPAEAAPTDGSAAPTESSGFSWLAVSGLIAIILAIILLGALIFMLLRQPR